MYAKGKRNEELKKGEKIKSPKVNETRVGGRKRGANVEN
jgi:hypothetical protein